MDGFQTGKHGKAKDLPKPLNPLYHPHTLTLSEKYERIKKTEIDQMS